MVMLYFSPACANLREGREEGNGKALNGEKFMANGFCGELKCENWRFCSRRDGATRRRAVLRSTPFAESLRAGRMTSALVRRGSQSPITR